MKKSKQVKNWRHFQMSLKVRKARKKDKKWDKNCGGFRLQTISQLPPPESLLSAIGNTNFVSPHICSIFFVFYHFNILSCFIFFMIFKHFFRVSIGRNRKPPQMKTLLIFPPFPFILYLFVLFVKTAFPTSIYF